ncbi:hypothetical protein Pse7367_3516 [Thalassoporum mexicanum PCC 7367]|uniref:AAA family ATPase n=1 Tax=Thalassoporum mexicanum TaxID=3457544 RepID=UPI00029FE401|nr:AAA family ATPase [Pseudanabaena sp. PCC 7367]AFY71751.1 hypothetical protein Pse7367_3516 [Pseudanabaena sp. PCC 7367]
MLHDLSIKNFRCFQDFQIDDLARVNLIVGKNNSGKTCFLEAIYLLTNGGWLHYMTDMLDRREEYASSASFRDKSGLFYDITNIFYGREPFISNKFVELSSSSESVLNLSVALRSEFQKQAQLPLFDTDLSSDDINRALYYLVISNHYPPTGESIYVDDQGIMQAPSYRNRLAYSRKASCLFISPKGLSLGKLSSLWDDIRLTSKEDKVIKSLKILEPDISGIHFSSASSSNSISVLFKGQKVPIGTLGEGVQRILTLAIHAVSVENGFLLVDDIDTGLYHGAQLDMWRWIMQVAKELNIQVFATTHSWDCVAAFQEALEEIGDPAYGRLLRMERRDNGTQPVEYSARELAIAVDHGIEVR